jgi:hydroxyethylthiazole kinase-like uncharacterized protein yjeF
VRRPLFSIAEMAAADALAVASGVASFDLMLRAGRAVAAAIEARFAPQPVLALCGPGNNGGDGYVAAAALRAAGWSVRVASLSDPADLKGDAALARDLWSCPVLPSASLHDLSGALVIDALFGAGLTRPLEGEAARLVGLLLPERTVAIDMPSGLSGDGRPPSGPHGCARLTVAFHAPKIGHRLISTAEACGDVVIAPIGIPPDAALRLGVRTMENAPGLFVAPSPGLPSHKHTRGRLCVVAGEEPAYAGAGRLAARAGLAAGAGWVTLADGASPMEPASIVLARSGGGEGLSALAARHDAIVVGPGLGRGAGARARVTACLGAPAAVVDADGLSAFEGAAHLLFGAAPRRCVLTPHAGEFARLFPDLADGSKVECARAAAARAGCVVLLKGADTVIAAPDGRAAINRHASPHLATAGTGDVLAGLIGALLAQGMEAFEAACAGSWVHGEASLRIGRGLTADALVQALPAALAKAAR